MSAFSAKKFSAQQDISGLFSITPSSPGRHIILFWHVAQLWGGDYCFVPQPSSGPGPIQDLVEEIRIPRQEELRPLEAGIPLPPQR